MAQDIWDMLKAKGINARITVGDFEHGTANVIEIKNLSMKIWALEFPGYLLLTIALVRIPGY